MAQEKSTVFIIKIRMYDLDFDRVHWEAAHGIKNPRWRQHISSSMEKAVELINFKYGRFFKKEQPFEEKDFGQEKSFVSRDEKYTFTISKYDLDSGFIVL